MLQTVIFSKRKALCSNTLTGSIDTVCLANAVYNAFQPIDIHSEPAKVQEYLVTGLPAGGLMQQLHQDPGMPECSSPRSSLC